MYIPLNYEQINNINGHISPSQFKYGNNYSFNFWERALFHRITSVLKFTFPTEWQRAKDFILYGLFMNGFMGVAEDKDVGLFCQVCSLKGYDFYYQPKSFIVTNPKFTESKEYEIGETGELLKLTPDFMGAWDIIGYFASKLSLLDNAIDIGLINCKFPWIVGAKTKSSAQALKKIYDKANKGEPLIIFDQRINSSEEGRDDSPFQFLELGADLNHYIVPSQLQDFQTILNQFDTEIGIPTVPYQKKERMVESEADSKQIESVARLTTWVECLQNSMEIINKHFNTNLSVEMRFKGGADNGKDNIDRVE